MPDCRYCDASFGDEAAYLDHLRAAHADELGPIDRRRVAPEDAGGLPTGPVALAVVLVAAAAVVGYVVVFAGGGGTAADEPYGLGEVHYHGFIEVIIDGQRLDLSQPRYQLQADAFHFEGGDGTRWHVHARGVTLSWAMESIGITVTADSVTVEGTTHRDADPGTSVRVTVDDEPVTPATYVLQEGDVVRIVVDLA